MTTPQIDDDSLSDEWLDACSSVAEDLKLSITPVKDNEENSKVGNAVPVLKSETCISTPIISEDINKNKLTVAIVSSPRRKRRSERFTELLSNERAANGAQLCTMFPVKKSSRIADITRFAPSKIRKVDTTATSSIVQHQDGRIPGLSNDSLHDRLKFRSVQKMDSTKSKNKGFISKAIIDALARPNRVSPLRTDIDRSLPAIPLIKRSKRTDVIT